MKHKYQLDEYDLKMIHTALCYFDMYEDGSYDKWFGKEAFDMSEAFDYLYEISSQTPVESPVTPENT